MRTALFPLPFFPKMQKKYLEGFALQQGNQFNLPMMKFIFSLKSISSLSWQRKFSMEILWTIPAVFTFLFYNTKGVHKHFSGKCKSIFQNQFYVEKENNLQISPQIGYHQQIHGHPIRGSFYCEHASSSTFLGHSCWPTTFAATEKKKICGIIENKFTVKR